MKIGKRKEKKSYGGGIVSIGQTTKYDLRNFDDKDALALRVAYLIDQTWHRDDMRGVEWSSLHKTPKREGKDRMWGIGPLKLDHLVDKITTVVKQKYKNNPELLQQYFLTNNISPDYWKNYPEGNLLELVERSKEGRLYFMPDSINELEKANPNFANDEWHKERIRDTADFEKENPYDALCIGRMYLSDIAHRAYIELTGKNPEISSINFLNYVKKSIRDLDNTNAVYGESLITTAVNSLEIYRAIFR